MGEKWQDNLIYKIIAILLAVLLWLYVTADQNPPIEKTLSLNVNYENLRDDLTLTYNNTSVNIKIRGKEKVINSLGLEDFKANMDLSQVRMGEYTLPVKVSNPLGVEIVDINPKEMKVVVDKIAEKQVPVNIALLGQTAHGYSSFKASITPSHVVIRGPQKTLENIVEARAEVNLNNAQANLVLSLPIKVQDRWGNLYGSDAFNITPNTVEVFVPIIQDTPSKTVPVKPIFEGKPALGFQIGRVVVEPETVKVLGPFNKLDAIDRVQTLPISMADATEDIIKEVDLSIPSGVTMLYGTKVKVMIQIEEGAIQKSFDLPVKVHNNKDDQKVVLSSETVKIKVEGKKDVVDKLLSEDFQIFVDVSGLEQGTHELEIQVDAPSDIQVLEINPAKLNAEINSTPTE